MARTTHLLRQTSPTLWLPIITSPPCGYHHITSVFLSPYTQENIKLAKVLEQYSKGGLEMGALNMLKKWFRVTGEMGPQK